MIDRVCMGLPIDKIAKQVIAMRDLWESRSYDFPFFTLGSPAYLDGPSPKYYEDAERLNPVLMEEFQPMYSHVSKRLAHVLCEPIMLKDNLALPGFHIFPSDPKFLTISGNWHTDQSHVTLGLGDEDATTFTYAIKLPTGGGGADFDENGKDVYVPYDEGEMVLHDGMTMHRISKYKKYMPNEYRITLQGHIIRDGGDLVMFW